MSQTRWVDPGDLRLAPGRQNGPDVWRLADQVSHFDGRVDDMPAIEVTEGHGGELMINNGVTRAVRAFRQAPGSLVPIEIFDCRPKANLTRLRRVRDLPR